MSLFRALFSIVKMLVGGNVAEGLLGKFGEVVAGSAKERLRSNEAWRDAMYSHWGAVSKLDPAKTDSEWVQQEFGTITEEELADIIDAAKTLIKRHQARDRKRDGSEELMMRVLGDVWKHLSVPDETGEPDLYLRNSVFYEFLGHLTPKKFDYAISAFHDDKFQQWFIKAARVLKHAGKLTKDTLATLLKELENRIPEPDQVRDAVKAADNVAVGALDNFNSWLDSKGVPR